MRAHVSIQEVMVVFSETDGDISETARKLNATVGAIEDVLLEVGLIEKKSKTRRTCTLSLEECAEPIRETGTLREAAKILGIAKPTLKRRLKKLGVTRMEILKGKKGA
jgi:transcriptional regulator of acetoin/glycerol metabolism